MKQSEYDNIQSALSELIKPERMSQKFLHSNYADTYKKAVLDCKSRLHNYFKFHNEEG